jgi:RHS repeat-associated protein
VDGTIEYTDYGFHREPLSFFFYKPATEAKLAAMTAKATVGVKSIQTKPVILAKAPPPPDGDPCGAYINAPQNGATVQVGQTVTFVGATDYGNVFNWSFGDGGQAAGMSTSHIYTTAGTYNIHLVVMDRNMIAPQSDTYISLKVLPLPPTVTLSTSAGTIAAGSSATLSWSTSGATTSLTLNGSAVAASGSLSVTPSQNTTYTLTGLNAGGSNSSTVTVVVVPMPTISTFTANPANIYQGDGTTLNWTVSGATSLSLDNGIGTVTGRSSYPVNPSGTTRYYLTATNTLNGVNAVRQTYVDVFVSPRPTVPTITFYSDASRVAYGGRTWLHWSVSNSVGNVLVTLNGSTVASSGDLPVDITALSTYNMVATNTQDTSKFVSKSVTVDVVRIPVIHISASPTNVYAGGSTTLTWTVDNYPDSVSIDQGLGTKAAAGQTTVTPGGSTTYTVTAQNIAGTSSASVTVGVTPSAVVGSFSASSTQITQGTSATLSWTTQGATSVTLNGNPVSASATGYVVSPTTTTTYLLVATNPAGSDSRSLNVTVIVPETFTWTKTLIYGFGQLLSEERPYGTFYIQSDRIGSPSLITDGGGRLVGQSKQLPFGERFSSWGEQSTRRYTNHEDQPGSAIYMQARMYLPAFGKFAQIDPAYDQTKDDPETWNLYNYVTNNPVTHTDPDGRVQVNIDGLTVINNNLVLSRSDYEYGNVLGSGGAFGTPITYICYSPIKYVDSSGTELLTLPGGSYRDLGGSAPSAQTSADRGTGKVTDLPSTVAPFQPKAAQFMTAVEAAIYGDTFIKDTYGATGDMDYREYGFYILKNSSGSFQLSTIIQGPIPQNGDRAAVNIDLALAQKGIPSDASLAGWYHSHPRLSPSGKLDLIPSSDGDVSGTRYLRGDSVRGDKYMGYSVDVYYTGFLGRYGTRGILEFWGPPYTKGKPYDTEDVSYAWH